MPIVEEPTEEEVEKPVEEIMDRPRVEEIIMENEQLNNIVNEIRDRKEKK